MIVAAILCYRAFNRRYNRELHLTVVRELEKMCPNTSVYVGYVAQHDSELVITDLCLADKRTHPKRPIFSAQRAILKGKLDITDLLQGQVRVDRVDVFAPQVYVWPTESGWSVDTLQPREDGKSKPVPEITLHQGTVHLLKDESKDAPRITMHDISGSIVPQASSVSATSDSLLEVNLSGRASGTVEKFRLKAFVAPQTQEWLAGGDVTGLQLGPQVYNDLPVQFSQFLKQVSGLSCQASAQYVVTKRRAHPLKFKLNGRLDHGRLEDPRLPYVLDNLHGEFTCENAQLQLRELRATSDAARLELAVDIDGLDLRSPMRVVANIWDLSLDNRLYKSLPSDLKKQWERMQLSGQVSGRIGLEFDGKRWRPEMTVSCEGVSIKPWLFPYPIDNLRGLVHFTHSPDRIWTEGLLGEAEGKAVRGRFDLQKPGDQWIGDLSGSTDGVVSVDEVLLSALTERGKPTNGAENFVRSLKPSGGVQLFNARFWRNDEQEVWHKEIDANVYNGSIRYEEFGYPITNIRGRIVCQDETWTLDRFEGHNSSAHIRCSGTWKNVRVGLVPFHLEFNAFNVPIEDELKQALPQQAQFVWDELQPLGSLDSVKIALERKELAQQVETLIHINEDSDYNATRGQSLRLRPKAFPYWLTEVDCAIEYTPELVKIRRASGINGRSRISMSGACEPTESGTWKANVQWLPQTRLWVDSELLKALPKSIRDSLVKIDLSGPISIQGSSSVEFGETREDPIASTWNCEMAIEEGKLGDGSQIGAMRGALAMQGQSKGDRVYARGTIFMDALTVLGVPVNNLQGPFTLDGTNLYFGSSVYEQDPPKSPDAVEHMVADALAGKLSITGSANLADNQGRFYISSRLQNANLKSLLLDLGVNSPTTEGIVSADLEFNGVPWNPQTYDGSGNIQLTEAQLYELPFMIRLLNIASVSPTSNSAIQKADVEFELDGQRIKMDVSCEGDLLWLRGNGETNLRRELYLKLYSYAGRRSSLGRVAGSLLPASKQATFMEVEINGTLDNPIMQRRAFPQITLQQIFPELATRRESSPLLPWRK